MEAGWTAKFTERQIPHHWVISIYTYNPNPSILQLRSSSVVYTQSNAKTPFLNGTTLSQTGISTPGVTYIIILPSSALFEAAAVLRPANNHESRPEERCLYSLPDASSSSAGTTMAGNKRDPDSQRGFGATRFDQCGSFSFCQYAKCSSIIWYGSQRVLEKGHFANRRLREIDARFEVIGTPYSLLSVSLSASQNLYTRRGTLVGLNGKADNVCTSSCLIWSKNHLRH